MVAHHEGRAWSLSGFQHASAQAGGSSGRGAVLREKACLSPPFVAFPGVVIRSLWESGCWAGRLLGLIQFACSYGHV